MIVEIEYYKGDILLMGKPRGMTVLKRQFAEIEGLFDKENDNFTELLCRRFGWEVIQTDEPPDYIYDCDTGIFSEAKR